VKEQITSTPANWSCVIARVFVGLILIVSGVLKAAAPAEEFALIIDAYNIVPANMTLTLAAFLPWLEILAGFALLLGWCTRAAAVSACAMLISFIFALTSTLIRHIALPNCGCFGQGWHATPAHAASFDLILLSLAFLALRGGQRLSLDNWARLGL